MFILVLVLGVEFLVAILLAKGDFARPSVIVSGVMLGASICASYLSGVWQFTLTNSTIAILLSSVLQIIVVDTITQIFFCKKRTRTFTKVIEVDRFILILIVIFSIIIMISHYGYLVRAVGNLGSLSQMISMYRNRLVWGTLTTTMPGLLSRGIRFLSNFAYIYLYIFINNCIATRKIVRNLKFLLPVVLYSMDSMLMGARGYLIYLVFAAVIYGYVLYEHSIGWRFKEGFKYIKKVLIVLGVVAIVFVSLGSFVGRSSTGSIWYRLSLYFGGGIALLNDYFITGGAESPGGGAVTFTTFYSFMSRRFGWTDYSEYMQFEFRYHNGINWGNVYTALRRYHQDFGYVGVFVMVTIFAAFFGVYYNRIRNRKKRNSIDISLLYYGIMVRAQFLFFFDDELFNDFFTPSIIVNIVELLICLFVVRTQINITRNKAVVKIPKYKLAKNIIMGR